MKVRVLNIHITPRAEADDVTRKFKRNSTTTGNLWRMKVPRGMVQYNASSICMESVYVDVMAYTVEHWRRIARMSRCGP